MSVTHQATLEKMQQLRLHGMTAAFRASLELPSPALEKITTDEFVAHLIDAEWEERANRKLGRLIKSANFRYRATYEHIDFSAERKLDKNLMLRLSSCQWIEKAQNVLVSGGDGRWQKFSALCVGTSGMSERI